MDNLKAQKEIFAPCMPVQPLRFGGNEFRFGSAEMGACIWEAVGSRCSLADGLAEEHHWVLNLGWITFRVRSKTGFDHAARLMRLCYLRYALKTEPLFMSMFEKLVPKIASTVAHGPVPRRVDDLFVCDLWNTISSC
jgi:hypothetical protein